MTVDLGGTKIRSTLAIDGHVTRRTSLATHVVQGNEQVTNSGLAAIRKVKASDAIAVGIASTSVVSPLDDRIVSATDLTHG